MLDVLIRQKERVAKAYNKKVKDNLFYRKLCVESYLTYG